MHEDRSTNQDSCTTARDSVFARNAEQESPMQTPHPDEPPVVILADDNLNTLDALQALFHERLPGLHVLTTNSVEPSVNVLLEANPKVIISGLDPDRVRGYNFMRRAADRAPAAHKVLLCDKHLDSALLHDLGIIAAIRRPPNPDTLVDLVAGLAFGEMDTLLEEVRP